MKVFQYDAPTSLKMQSCSKAPQEYFARTPQGRAFLAECESQLRAYMQIDVRLDKFSTKWRKKSKLQKFDLFCATIGLGYAFHTLEQSDDKLQLTWPS